MSAYEEWDMFADIAAITRWLDSSNPHIPGDDAMRVMKIGEELAEAHEILGVIDVAFGRAVAAFIGMTGQNPRKGITHTQADLCKELADVAVTALCAIAHFTSSGYGTYNPHIVRAYMASKIQEIMSRSHIPPLSEHETGEPTFTVIDGERPA